MKNKPIAILGGMGPQASSQLLEDIIFMASRDFGAKNDNDFPEIILNSLPVPDFISNKKNLIPARQVLKVSIKRMESFSPISFSIACNTAHILFDDLRSYTKVPFISIIAEVTRSASNARLNSVGLLATPVTIQSGLYQNALRAQNINCIVLSKKEQIQTEKIIRNILAGEKREKDRTLLVSLAKHLEKQGSEGIILGCTELPLLFPKQFQLPVFDSINILARAILKNFYGAKLNLSH